MTGINISAGTRVAALLGYPVGHSVSPAMMNAAMAKLGLNMVYVALEVRPADLPAAIDGVRSLGLTGVNLTIPHKEAVLPCLDAVSDDARVIGAVNTIVNQDGRLIGHNTDGRGFLAALEGYRLNGKCVVILGAGGAARAVAVTCALQSTGEIVLVNRTRERALAIAERITDLTRVKTLALVPDAEELSQIYRRADLVVNTTPLGMEPEPERLPPIDPDVLHPGMLVYDLIYRPVRTRLLQEAEQRGCRTISGLGMLVYQGALALQLWTGEKAPVETMWEAARRELGIMSF